MSENTSLPEMSRHEASWHEHLAGMRASAAARKQGGDPAAITALATATAGPVLIGTFKLWPASQGTVWTLQRVAREFSAWANALGMPKAGDHEPDGTREILELGLSTLVFADSLRVWHMLETGRLEDLISEAEQLMWEVPVDVYRSLENHFDREMGRIRRLHTEDAPKKKPATQAESGTSPVIPIPPTATPSHPSNGCVPSMGFHSPMPSGGPVS